MPQSTFARSEVSGITLRGRAVWRGLRSIRTKFVIVYLLLILFAMQLIGAYFVRTLTVSLIHSATDAAENQAQLIATIAAPEINSNQQPGKPHPSIISTLPQLFSGAVYILNKDGVVIDSSAGAALIGQKLLDSVATQAMVAHARAVAIHYDTVTGQHLLAIAVPIVSQRQFVGIAEYVVPIQATYNTVRQVTTIFYTGSALVLTLTAVLGVVLSRTMTRPILDVIKQARNMAAGDFTQRVSVHSDDELGDLSTAINDLADKLEEALSENTREKERLRAVITYMGDGVIAFDASLQPVFQNRAAEGFLRNTEEPAADVLGISKLVAEGVAERAFLKPVGTTVLHVHFTSIHKNGDTEGYVAVMRDVTEQEKLQDARRNFVANVSHELRTPLTSIKSYIEALQDDQTDAGLRETFLRVIEQETNRMVRLTEDLLQLSGLEMGKAPFNERVIPVQQWLFDAVHRFQFQAQSRNVQLTLTCPEDANVKGDRDWLDRLMDNLLSNALKYTPDNGRVEVAVTVEPDDVEICVSDNGIGIPAEDLPHVFERFYRVDKARSRRMGGTGLGLALVREITERHGGTVALSSQVGEGTQVFVRLPRSEGEKS